MLARAMMKTNAHRTWPAVLLLGSLLLFGALVAPRSPLAESPPPASNPLRLISLNPSLSAIVLRLGAGDSLVGIDDYSARVLPSLAALPRVGGLFDPSLESVVSLRPDRVLLVAGVDQQNHADRLERAGLKVEIYPNERLEEVLENIERLGALLGRQDLAAARIHSILEMREAVRKAAVGRTRPGTLAVVDRSPLYLVGAGTFLSEMLDVVGAENLGSSLGSGYPRASIEWLIASRPELLLDMTPGATRAADFWTRWPSIPAVSSGRVIDVDASRISLPGPDIDQALRELAIAVHGAGIAAAIDAQLEKDRAP
jgi:iron complex transport system substrate-binding protein